MIAFRLLTPADVAQIRAILPDGAELEASTNPLWVRIRISGDPVRLEVGDWLISDGERFFRGIVPTAADEPRPDAVPVRGEAALINELSTTKLALARANNLLSRLGYEPINP